MKRVTLLILGLCCVLTSQATTDWELAKDEDGIKIYTREVDGWDTEEFKAVANIKATRLVIFQTLMDVVSYPNWYPDIAVSELTKTISDNEIYCYSKIDLPWPSDDRDGESHFKATHNKEEKTTTIQMTACEKYKSRQDGYVRMTKGQGFWKLTSKEGYTTVHYQYLSDPGGSIPSWLINMFIVDNPFNTMQALKKRVENS